MKVFRNFSLLRWISLALITSAILLVVFQLVVFSRLRSNFNTGTTIGGVDVSGLTVSEAADRITQAYSVAVELHYGDSFFLVKPTSLGFTLNLDRMMAAADQARASLPFWPDFMNYLFNRTDYSEEIPLDASIDIVQMRSFLESEVAARYDKNPEPYEPVPGSIFFEMGDSGTSLDVDRSIELVTLALESPTARVVNLSTEKISSSRPTLNNLKVMLAQIIDVDGFTGIAEIYMLDLQTREELQFAYSAGEQLNPGIAFSALSTIKIPIMIDVYRHLSEPIDPEYYTLLEGMIIYSQNESSDALMKRVIDPSWGPLNVTETVENLGLENTFLAGMFYNGAPLLKVINTPANTRTDIVTSPDIYSQTTPTEMGQLLDDIYQCSQNGGGSLAAAFPGQISQSECRAMIGLLSQNRNGTLIEAGLPDGTQMGHKHGYATESDQVIHNINDAALVYSPGGNYVLTIYIYDDDQIIWDTANNLYADLSRAVYNYFNISNQ